MRGGLRSRQAWDVDCPLLETFARVRNDYRSRRRGVGNVISGMEPLPVAVRDLSNGPLLGGSSSAFDLWCALRLSYRDLTTWRRSLRPLLLLRRGI